MKPAPFEYHCPATLDEALDLLARYGDEAKVLAGGQSLVPLMNMRLVRPRHIIDINRLPGLDRIELVGSSIRVGALVRHKHLLTHPLVAEHAPLLREAAGFIGHPPIRTRGTVLGSLVHGHPAAELPVAFVALQGSLHVLSTRGRREIRARELFQDYFSTALAPDELATHATFPALPPRTGYAMEEFSRRKGDFALVAVACLLRFSESGRAVEEARVVFGGVGPTPVDTSQSARELVGQSFSRELLEELARRAAATLDPPADVHASAEYRRELARGLALRALLRAAERGVAQLAS